MSAAPLTNAQTPTPTGDAPSRPLAAIGWFLGAVFCFAVMDTLIKWLTAGYGTWQIVFFRAFFAILPLIPFIIRGGGWRSLRTNRLTSHILRALVGVATVFCFFYAFGQLPLADVYAIHFTSPLIMTALSVPLLGEAVGWRRWAAVLVGFAGVLIMLQPGQGAGMPLIPALICLGGAFGYSLTILYLRILSRTESNVAMVFYFISTLAAVSGVAMLPGWVTPTPLDFVLLVLVGIIGGVAQLLISQAFRLGPPALLAPFEYTGMLWAVGFGFIVFGELPGLPIGLGALVVIASGLYIFRREAQAARRGR